MSSNVYACVVLKCQRTEAPDSPTLSGKLLLQQQPPRVRLLRGLVRWNSPTLALACPMLSSSCSAVLYFIGTKLLRRIVLYWYRAVALCCTISVPSCCAVLYYISTKLLRRIVHIGTKLLRCSVLYRYQAVEPYCTI